MSEVKENPIVTESYAYDSKPNEINSNDINICIYKILKEVKQEPNCFIYDNKIIYDSDYENDLKNTLANIKYVILEKMLIEK